MDTTYDKLHTKIIEKGVLLILEENAYLYSYLNFLDKFDLYSINQRHI